MSDSKQSTYFTSTFVNSTLHLITHNLKASVTPSSTLAYLPWSVQILMIAAAAALYRKRGGFYYRSAAAVTWLLIIAAYGMAASLILPLFGQRKLINWTVARLYYYCAGYFTAVSAVVENEANLETGGPAVYICNHQSSIDVLLMARVFPKSTSVVAKKSIKFYPILGWYMSLSKAVFLDRSNRDSAVASAKKAAEDIHKKETSVFIFPEGTRGHPREINMLPFKKGAFHMAVQAGVPIVPIVIANYNHLYDSKAKRFNSGVVPIRVLDPISTEGLKDSHGAVDKLTTDVRELMLNALKEISPPTLSKKSE
ncbi:hypothetical protein INT44_000003 [Umbelopsis vinacea]|uniref:1-acyl-sn-glycerol-3-phosphate acyltransferase n=1 Tax=Umbelopsis vinacea TaxID=44442 RepID=A0A8H7PHP2_9FUNG|nr:hypothetical protein INT44_000003 [Umbelopsis vinacea]